MPRTTESRTAGKSRPAAAHRVRLGPTGPSTSDGPDSRTAAALAGHATGHILEVLTGRRPLHQIRQWVSGPVAGLLATMVRGTSTTPPGYRLRSVHACPTTARTVEACAIITDTRRAWALTMRLERQHEQWFCTLLAFV